MVCGWKGAIAPDKYSRRIRCGWIFRAGHPSSNFLCERGGVASQCKMADSEREYCEEEEEEAEEDTGVEEKDEPKADLSEEPKPEISEAELAMEKMRKKKEEEEAMWAEYIEQRKKQKAKEEEELRKLKERQMKRKERRKEEEKKLLALKKQQEAQRIKEMEEKKAREAEAKKKRLEEAEKKRQAMQDALQRNKIQEPVTPNFIITKRNEDGSVVPGIDKFPSSLYMKAELSKTKEQLAEDKKIALAFRVKPLQIENLSVAELKQRALQLWDVIVRLESEKYDLEERRKRQEYDLKELSERQRQINRSKALKKGLDPEALSGKYPPMINVASKYERRLDRRNFSDKKSLFEGGYVSQLEAMTSSEWENRMRNFKERGPSRLLKWNPNEPKNKEKQENAIEEEDLGELDFIPPQDPIETQQESNQNKDEEEAEEGEAEEEEEEEGEEEE
ncbi:troponin T, skeletal muscle [Trichonephila clavata]|uniref:Troponin T, skeletal muscle n=1 Tax=Trichonephila clavata TaxID=2740835 RepID=A0A8X6IC85_TRICU|nr:troponin T, skeletal muscle [Trichonephila clavata]